MNVITTLTVWDEDYRFLVVRYDSEEGATLGYLVTDRGNVAAVSYDDGMTFVPSDCQGTQPDVLNPDQVATTNWVGPDGQPAVMINGLPRQLLN